MRRVYSERVSAAQEYRSVTADTCEEPLREAADRILERATKELQSSVQLVSLSLTIGLDGTAVAVALVEDIETGFRPLGS